MNAQDVEEPLAVDGVAGHIHAANMKMYLREVGHGTMDREPV